MNPTVNNHIESSRPVPYGIFRAGKGLTGELSRCLLSHRQMILLSFGAIFAIVLIATLYFEHKSLNTQVLIESYEDNLEDVWHAVKLLYLPIISISASMMFADLSSVRSRVWLLSTPVGTFNKFAARFLLYIVGTTLAYWLSVGIADLIRYAVFSVLYFNTPIKMSFLARLLSDQPELLRNYIHHGIPVFTFIASLFGFGSIFWPKSSFVKTFCALFAVGVVGLIWIGILSSSIGSKSSDMLSFIFDSAPRTIVFWNSLAAFNWFLTYLRLKETDIIGS